VPKFKPGDIVICVRSEKRFMNLHKHCFYTVKSNKLENPGGEMISVKEIKEDLFYLEGRFRLIKSA